MRGTLAVSIVAVGALLAAPAAFAATLSVDDDRQDCSDAAYTSVQAAVDAAAPGDTVTLCPGTYVEGSGAPGTNAVTIDKSLTLKGAGADLVRITPLRRDGNGGQIAEASQDIRKPVGNILTAVGAPAVPITVDVSGITFDGNGIVVKAGVVFVDAQGSLFRSRVTDIVTSDRPEAFDDPGGYRSASLGYGIAQVTRSTTAPAPTGARTLTVTTTRVDQYNRVGMLVDGGTDAASPVTPSGVDLRAVVANTQIVGRNLCTNFQVDGQCGAPSNGGNPTPQPITDGPLFGQDGLQLAAGARGTVTGSLLTQNLVQGTGAPVRGSATNNSNLPLASGIRMIGADAAGSSITTSNIVDNAYGVYNAGGDGSSAPASAVPAKNNWWGLRSPVGGGQPQPPNTGPAISPATNPGAPENPVNGGPTPGDGGTTTSTAVDFQPYRSGPQSEPNTGQFAILPAPMPVNDAGPAVSVSPEKAQYRRGETVKLTATPSDDFGIRRVSFFDGATGLGDDDSPAYTAAFTIPADAACGSRAVSAVAEDSLGQTGSGTGALEVVCDSGSGSGGGSAVGGGSGALEPPTVRLPDNLRRIPRTGTTVTVSPTARQGVARVNFFLGARRVCRDSEAPYACLIKPRSTEIGSQTLRAVVVDNARLTGQDSRQVVVPRFKPRALRITVASRPQAGDRVLRTVTATVVPPKGVARAAACKDGSLAAVVRRGRTTLLDRERNLSSRCRVVIMRVSTRRDVRSGLRFKVSARFGGTTVLAPARKTRRFS